MISISEITKEWKKDSFIDKKKIAEESIRAASLHSKYLEEMMFHKNKLLKLESDYAIMRKLRIRYYNGALTQEELIDNNWVQYQGKRLLKSDMNDYLAGDSYLTDISNKITYEKNAIYALEQILKFVHNWTFQTGGYTDQMKFEAGY